MEREFKKPMRRPARRKVCNFCIDKAESIDYKDSGMPGTSRYITTKNRKNTTERLELKKYNPILKRVTVHKEIK